MTMANNLKRPNVLKLYKQLIKYVSINKNLTAAQYLQTNAEDIRDFLRNEFKLNTVTDAKYCMEKDQMVFLGSAYLTYLDSTKKTLALYSRYCKGERSIEESAAIVGLKLPKLYQENEK